MDLCRLYCITSVCTYRFVGIALLVRYVFLPLLSGIDQLEYLEYYQQSRSSSHDHEMMSC